MANRVKVSDMPNSVYIEDADVLGKLVKAKRTKLNMKLADCAALCGVGINTLSRIENGNANCTLSAVFSVLQGLGIKLTTRELLTPESNSLADNEWV
ncbi:helix-turn-helix domain-containing protein [Colwellia sp. PAMC 21821]|uniref:helix-turn-helix domain-containing protein n=1 Tax=Colwellia sp. PAMC 21821 TaxID=1816219 RepID=UPI0009BFF37F|nr:helix-turn-helix domain-containing protein [Colwellia sp. PAMC 21821]ARD44457.1 transcriptional regulator [Colwellia sp. PAMC 21821]